MSVFSLEAAASRFEDIADLPLVLDPSAVTRRSNPGEAEYGAPSSSHPPLPPPPPPPPPPPQPAVPTVTTSAAAPVAATPTNQVPAETPKSVSAFQENVINGKLKPFIESTQSFAGPNVIEVVRL